MWYRLKIQQGDKIKTFGQHCSAESSTASAAVKSSWADFAATRALQIQYAADDVANGITAVRLSNHLSNSDDENP